MNDTFSTYHPLVNFLFYGFVLGISMFFMHPVLMGISALGAVLYVISLKGKKAVVVIFAMCLPVMLLSAIINPLFTHQGVTILYYFKSGNPLTLESIVYGIAAGAMMAVVILWFSSLNVVLTSDKFVYLFGKILPAISLLLSMVFRFTPRFYDQMGKVSAAQKGIGRDAASGNVWQKLRQGTRILSIMVTWSLENSVETAASMKSRGYGLRGRTNFHLYTFSGRDKIVLAVMLLTFLGILGGITGKQLSVLYYPIFRINGCTPYAVVTYVLYGIVCFLPVILKTVEDMKWRCLKSKI